MKSQALIFATLCAFLAGCATPLKPNQVEVTYETQPPGGFIYEGQKSWGAAPVTLITTATDAGMRAGYVEFKDMFAVWPSGARTTGGVKLDLKIKHGTVTFSRPPDAPGLDKDLAYAAQLRQIKASEEQASAASSAAIWQMYNSMQPKSPTYTDCTKIGSSVNCTTW